MGVHIVLSAPPATLTLYVFACHDTRDKASMREPTMTMPYGTINVL